MRKEHRDQKYQYDGSAAKYMGLSSSGDHRDNVLHDRQNKVAKQNPNLVGNQVFVPDNQRVRPDVSKEKYGVELGDVGLRNDKELRRLKRAAGGAAKIRKGQYY